MADPTIIASRLLDKARAADFKGHDPFDALNSRLFQWSQLGRIPLARLAFLQLFKRLPVNLRPLALVPRARNPKGVALFAMGMLALARTKEGNEARSLREEARDLGRWLLGARVDPAQWTFPAWGYHFAWQARAFHVPKGTPNAISTCYVASALRDLHDLFPDEGFGEAARDAGRFLATLHTERDGRRYFAYIPGEDAFVHNANLWVAALVAESARELGDEDMMALALANAQQSVDMQEADGSWLYGTRDHHAFVDGFHTGYNLEALDRMRQAAHTDRFDAAIARGYAYYVKTFIGEDGAVSYYAHEHWPEETHSVAQAIITLIQFGDDDGLATARRVADHAVDTLWLERRGSFAYRRGKVLTNRIDYARWSQAWGFLSFARLAAASETAR